METKKSTTEIKSGKQVQENAHVDKQYANKNPLNQLKI
eukprot:CAMPEP_0117421954 /NCGR_PEP_ID=MMETSP0758-20121206/2905_1 /TAXON_ID=63605 /ORGANISM="Percolomonas cosmopolitus, Strain AE-1 (ATCC 50343)" /LENGTH=37 /DNA_ID= /DNA_START= /DNA_END= /DNA_ORIENTATION=